MIELDLILIGFTWFCSVLLAYKYGARRKKEKPKNNNTDFENLQIITEIYNSINFDNLRPDQIDLWDDWVKRKFIKS